MELTPYQIRVIELARAIVIRMQILGSKVSDELRQEIEYAVSSQSIFQLNAVMQKLNKLGAAA